MVACFVWGIILACTIDLRSELDASHLQVGSLEMGGFPTSIPSGKCMGALCYGRLNTYKLLTSKGLGLKPSGAWHSAPRFKDPASAMGKPLLRPLVEKPYLRPPCNFASVWLLGVLYC